MNFMNSFACLGDKLLKECRHKTNELKEYFLFPDNLVGYSNNTLPRDGHTPLVDRFAGILSVCWEDLEKGCFILNQGGNTNYDAACRIIEINPILYSDEAMDAALERLLQIDFPDKTCISVSLYAGPNVRGLLQDFVDTRVRENMKVSEESRELLYRMAIARAREFDLASRTSRFSGSVFPVRNFRVWIAITTQIGELDDVNSWQRFITASDAFEATLQQFSLMSYRWKRENYINTVRELVNPHKCLAGELDAPNDDVLVPMRDRVVDHDSMIDVKKNSIEFSSPGFQSVEAVAVGVTGYPSRIHINAMAGLMGSDGASGVVLEHPYIVTEIIEPTSLIHDKANIGIKCARVKQLQRTEIGQFLSDLGERENDLEVARTACEKHGGLALVAHELVVFAPKGKAQAAAETAKAVLQESGFSAQVDMGLQMMGNLMTLPGEAGSGLMRDATVARHVTTKTRLSASHMMPLLCEFRGLGPRIGATQVSPLLLMVSRRGQLFGIDMFANRNGNFNSIVVGTSGSGKSVLAQEVVMSMLATGARVWVFDIGRSYKNCVDLVQGQWIDFENSSSLCLNPLDMMQESKDTLDEIAQIISVMANGDVPLSLTDMELLKVGIDQTVTMARSKGKVPTITDLIIELLRAHKPSLDELAIRLAPYGKGGRYAHWFEGEANIDFSSAFVALEMEALSNKPVLQNAVLLILIMCILQNIRSRPRSERKLIVIDEAWRLLKGNSGQFIEWACRTLRKYGAGIMCISQSMEDFDVSETARAVRMNADTVFLLRQKKQSVSSYTTNAYVAEKILGLTTRSEVYSEVYVKVGDLPGVVGRIALDEFSMTAYSTRADIYDKVKREHKRLGSIVEAISSVAYAQRSES